MMLKKAKIYTILTVLLTAAPFSVPKIYASGLSTNAALELLSQLEMLQQEVQSLRGQLEQQDHELRLMRQSQRDRYIDLDRRISVLMTSSANKQNSEVPSSQLQTTNAPPVVASNASAVNRPTVLLSSPLAPVTLQSPTDESRRAYNAAYNLIRERKFEEAEKALVSFVETFKTDTLTVNGYYWLGEVKLVQNKRDSAVVAFTTVVEQFPGHDKVPDALYKLGTVNDQLSKTEEAKAHLQDVIRRFPDSRAAQLAAGYLNNMK